jgi:hypothetical protein
MQRRSAKIRDHCRAPLKMAWYYRRLLLDWANLGSTYTSHGAEFYSHVTEELRKRHPRVVAPLAADAVEFVVANVGMLLRRAWQSKDLRERTWFLNLARNLYARGCIGFGELGMNFFFSGLPEGDDAVFDSALAYAQTNLARRMQVCKASCITPYFFREEKGQKYCSTDCSDPVRDAGQRRYWKKRGRLLRAERARKLRALKSRA